jgi:hypothetical protein
LEGVRSGHGQGFPGECTSLASPEKCFTLMSGIFQAATFVGVEVSLKMMDTLW